ncbi:MAG: hypothetical protein ABIN80_28600 [Dyadobacter sp.]|uniref:hypothetical protein n=1 Tax=Dyadobacter sp. TaxID=1914288 RepID=UPI003266271F
MKILSVALLVLSLPALSQDLLVSHGAPDRTVSVVSVDDYSIKYAYPGESVTRSIGRAAVAKIVYASGRIEKFSDMVNVSGRDGWENVVITNNPNEVIGLQRAGEIKSKAGGYWSMRSTKGSDRKATERIKREAAALGGHVVYIQQHQTKGRGFYSNPESIQSGVAYGYGKN